MIIKEPKRLFFSVKLLLFFLIFFSASALPEGYQPQEKNYVIKKNNSSVEFITADNIKNIEMAWVSHVGDFNIIETTPILANNLLITASRSGILMALDPESGKKIWSKKLGSEVAKRGLSYSNGVIYSPTSKGVFAINPNNGEILTSQGLDGKYGNSMSFLPPIVDSNFLITANYDSLESFNLESGKLNWKTILKKDGVVARLWSGINYDKENQLIFVVTSNPDNNQLDHDIKNGGYANSLIALNSLTGKVVWQFQETRHDLWDLDVVGKPIIFNYPLNNKIIPAVAAVTKSGNTLLVNRITGAPIFESNYEYLHYQNSGYGIASQLKITKPNPFSSVIFDLNKDVTNVSNEKRKYIHHKLRNTKQGLHPVTVGSDIVYYGLHGGANWAGANLNTVNNVLYVPSNKYPWIVRAQYFDLNEKFTVEKSMGNKTYRNKCLICHQSNLKGFHQGEIDGDLYIPSLVGITKFRNKKDLLSLKNFEKDHKYLPEKEKISHLNAKSISNSNFNKIIQSVTENDLAVLYTLFLSIDSDIEKRNNFGSESFWQLLLDQEGLPGSRPPWGYISAIDLNSGNIKWQKPFGEVSDKKYKKKILGDMNFGGINLDIPKLIIASGTRDSSATFFDAADGKILHKIKLPYAGSSPPYVYTFNNCQYIIFTSTGSLFSNFRRSYGDALVSFKPKTCH
ncbi:hypothetical protein FIT77_04180 [Candidatus Methylopumilus universalis]|uniref:outer membrane protein assembly factor BamB family protein n=1 Tax=Candidatus Methylopumilus universalis TaxID=2588536 RepID=UPI001120E759|nr:PQQ-binding-like beta-propeller repeat protein [Candidatus Methylopumilus universalis]QDC96497.1 hypothetical protein FIT77_04180 [Candidatus Methylopumilus universalis]